jgi:hypothetical protein
MKNSDKEKIKSILIAGHKDLALSLLQSQGLSEKASNEFISSTIREHCKTSCKEKLVLHCRLCEPQIYDGKLTLKQFKEYIESIHTTMK